MTTPRPPDPEPERRLRLRRALLVSLGVVILVTVAVSGYATGVDPASRSAAERQAEVAARGATVMPFDLERTTHVFAERPDGGVQTVTSDDPADAEQIALIREHLRAEADAFARGDFGDPATIHGEGMPGLAELRAGASRIDIRYEQAPAGARLTYRTTDPSLIDAVHTWFRAQTSDHGGHAEGGHAEGGQ